jgi:epoxyqueuosine reductase
MKCANPVIEIKHSLHRYMVNEMKTVTDMLQSEFEKLHAKFRTVSIIHLKDLEAEITGWKQNGLITEKFYTQNYGDFLFQSPLTPSNTRSIVIIGVPQKFFPVTFIHKKKQYHTVIPPTYVYSKIRTSCKEILTNVLEKKGYSVEPAILPLKLLAVKSGLGKYGTNNICYVNGMGSFTRLQGFYTNYEFSTDDWQEKEVMESCQHCSLCQNACPTHCIPKNRFLIHADRCLTHLNENEGDFPSWVPTQSHNALVGCMHCQMICPQNTKYLQTHEQTINFTEEETSIILRKTPREQIPKTLAKKLIDFNMNEYYSLLGRNLIALINK